PPQRRGWGGRPRCRCGRGHRCNWVRPTRPAGTDGAGSSVDVTLDAAAVPVLPHTRDLAVAGYVPGGSRRNLDWVRNRLDTGPVDEVTLTLLADAQTSGGLLFGLAPQAADAITRLRSSGHDCAVIGRAVRGSGLIRLR